MELLVTFDFTAPIFDRDTDKNVLANELCSKCGIEWWWTVIGVRWVFYWLMPNVQANRRAAPTLAELELRTGPSG